MHSDESYVLRSLKAGAKAYLLKDSAESDLISAISGHHRRKVVLQSWRQQILKEDYVFAAAPIWAPKIPTSS